jgi:hypothetical protein
MACDSVVWYSTQTCVVILTTRSISRSSIQIRSGKCKGGIRRPAQIQPAGQDKRQKLGTPRLINQIENVVVVFFFRFASLRGCVMYSDYAFSALWLPPIGGNVICERGVMWYRAFSILRFGKGELQDAAAFWAFSWARAVRAERTSGASSMRSEHFFIKSCCRNISKSSSTKQRDGLRVTSRGHWLAFLDQPSTRSRGSP